MAELFHDPEFWVLIAFVVFVAAAAKKGYVAITGVLDGRATKIKEELDAAVQLREEAQALLASYQRQQRDSVKETERIVALAREMAENEIAEAKTKLKDVLERRRRTAKEKIAQAEARAIADIQTRIIDVALAATTHVIAESLDESRSQALVDQAIDGLESRLTQ